jgi:transcriptional regulator with XRE-family HTH domain
MAEARLEFQLTELYEALDEGRKAKGLTWQALLDEINGNPRQPRGIAVSTVTGLRTKRVAEGDGILGMLVWLGRSPESFMPGHPLASAPGSALPQVRPGHRGLRWDVQLLYAAIQSRRAERALTWQEVADEIGCSKNSLTGLVKARRVGFPGVMNLVWWLERPAADFVRSSKR